LRIASISLLRIASINWLKVVHLLIENSVNKPQPLKIPAEHIEIRDRGWESSGYGAMGLWVS